MRRLAIAQALLGIAMLAAGLISLTVQWHRADRWQSEEAFVVHVGSPSCAPAETTCDVTVDLQFSDPDQTLPAVFTVARADTSRSPVGTSGAVLAWRNAGDRSAARSVPTRPRRVGLVVAYVVAMLGLGVLVSTFGFGLVAVRRLARRRRIPDPTGWSPATEEPDHEPPPGEPRPTRRWVQAGVPWLIAAAIAGLVGFESTSDPPSAAALPTLSAPTTVPATTVPVVTTTTIPADLACRRALATIDPLLPLEATAAAPAHAEKFDVAAKTLSADGVNAGQGRVGTAISTAGNDAFFVWDSARLHRHLALWIGRWKSAVVQVRRSCS